MTGGTRSRETITGRRAFQAGMFGAGAAILLLALAGAGAGAPVAVAAPPAQAVATPAVQPPVVEPPVVDAPEEPALTGFEITARDIAFDPNALEIPARRAVRIDLENDGAALHSFMITSRNNPDLPDLGIAVELEPGKDAYAIVNAPPGTYYFYCDEPGHEAAGMHGSLTVR